MKSPRPARWLVSAPQSPPKLTEGHTTLLAQGYRVRFWPETKNSHPEVGTLILPYILTQIKRNKSYGESIT